MGVWKRWQRILTSRPQDEVAARVTRPEPVWQKNNPAERQPIQSWIECPALPKVPANIRNLTGRIYGRLTVVGFWSTNRKNAKRRQWMTRCECGIHEPRQERMLENGTPQQLQCHRCRAAADIVKNLGG